MNYFAHRMLLPECRPDGLVFDPAQIAIEVSVPQPPGYAKPTVPRDLVIWAEPGATCWNEVWEPIRHPMSIIEWKVHRPGFRNCEGPKEDAWLRAYCHWQPKVLAYAIQVDGADDRNVRIRCTKYLADEVTQDWIIRRCGGACNFD